MAEGLFRKEQLERLSSPEQLEQLLQVTTPKSWMSLFAGGLLLAVAAFWGLYGTVETEVAGQGVLIGAGGLLDIPAPSAGVVTMINVNVGDFVEKGQLVGRVAQPKLMAKLNWTESELRRLQLSHGMEQEIEEKRAEAQLLKADMESGSAVISAYAGKVLQINSPVGSSVSVEDNLMTLAPMAPGDDNFVAVLYANAGDAKQIEPGMEVRISPSMVESEERGDLLGVVTRVAAFPPTSKQMLHNLRDPGLVAQMTSQSTPAEIDVALIPDPSTKSKFKWSSRAAPPVQIEPGMRCTAKVIAARQAPIALVLPWLKKRFVAVRQG